MELNKIYLGDCLELMKDIQDKSVDLVVTDPPYRTTKRGGTGNSGGMCKKKEFSEGRVFKFNDINKIDYMCEIYRILKDGSHFYIMTNHINLYDMLTVAKKVGFYFIKSLIWDKGNKIMGQAYMSQFEYILFFRKGNFKKINKCGTSDILNIPNKKSKDINGKNFHDTEKPVKLMEILIENSSNTGDIVLDPFIGIGTTAIACINTNRNFIGIEKDPNYYEIANNRIEEHK